MTDFLAAVASVGEKRPLMVMIRHKSGSARQLAERNTFLSPENPAVGRRNIQIM
jgi:hypothetical protein